MGDDWEDRVRAHIAQLPDDIQAAHKHSINHRPEIIASTLCGCFHCRDTFAPARITEWVDEADDGQGQTALCPMCGIDSVIGDQAGFDLSPEFLGRMHHHWFGTS
ncbi:MAG TPA: hypothetical protein VKQ32_22670 [Polyangia bacterium]|nr:hypothetical protein [Polyangia bacterium]